MFAFLPLLFLPTPERGPDALWADAPAPARQLISLRLYFEHQRSAADGLRNEYAFWVGLELALPSEGATELSAFALPSEERRRRLGCRAMSEAMASSLVEAKAHRARREALGCQRVMP